MSELALLITLIIDFTYLVDGSLYYRSSMMIPAMLLRLIDYQPLTFDYMIIAYIILGVTIMASLRPDYVNYINYVTTLATMVVISARTNNHYFYLSNLLEVVSVINIFSDNGDNGLVLHVMSLICYHISRTT